MISSPDLNAARRRRELELSASGIADVLVVGGGIVGAGTALDAALRGLSVTLIEAEDLAFGTSRFSSKLVHGGLRYLATGDFQTAAESAHERHLLMTAIAPHLIRPLPQLLPFAPGVTMVQRSAGSAGMFMGDLLRVRAKTSRDVLPGPRFVSARVARQAVPSIADRGLRGGIVSYDGQLADDARLVIEVARTAAAHGARILTRVRARALHGDRVEAVDTVSGERIEIRARSVINATGVWAGQLASDLTVRPSRGTHIVLDGADLGFPKAALTIPHEGSISRYVFALPQSDGRVLVGLTDEDAPGPVPDVAEPTEPEIRFLLDSINRVLETPIRRDRVRGAFAGLRPLIDAGSASTADVSRRHLVTASDDGVVSVLGGKLTTYRRMAEDAVDMASSIRGLDAGPSRTARQRLVSTRRQASEPVADGFQLTVADVDRAVRAEGAMTVDDVLDRRSRIGLVTADRERCAGPVTANLERALAELE